MNLSNTYFGFTNSLKPMQKAKVENTLDGLIRYDGKTITEKEYIFSKLQAGYSPIVEHDVSHYSRKLGDYTKPKTEYQLSNGSFISTISKTAYDYACHIVSNGFLDAEKANEYTIKEEQENTTKAQAEALRIATEEAERKAQKEKEEQEKEERKQAREKLFQDTKNAITDNELQKIAYISNAIQLKYNDILSNYDLQTVKDWVTKSIVMDRNYPETAISNIKYFIELTNKNSENPNRHNTQYIQNVEAVQDIRELFFGITLDMSNQMIRKLLNGELTAEEAQQHIKKAEQVKQRQLDKLTTFYRYINGLGFTEAQGERIEIEGITVYGMVYQDNYILIEESAGVQLSKGKNKTEAKENAQKAIEAHGIEKVKSLITQHVNKNGLSPLLQNAV